MAAALTALFRDDILLFCHLHSWSAHSVQTENLLQCLFHFCYTGRTLLLVHFSICVMSWQAGQDRRVQSCNDGNWNACWRILTGEHLMQGRTQAVDIGAGAGL